MASSLDRPVSNLFSLPKQTPVTPAGSVYAGAKAYFYRTGTSTPKDTYSDADLTTPNANPVVADSGGLFGPIFLDTSDFEYRLTLKTSADVLIYTQDNVGGRLSQAEFDALLNSAGSGGVGAALYPRTTAEIAASVTPTSYRYAPGNILRYGADPTGVSSSDSAGQAMLDQRAQGGAECYVPSGTYKQTVVWTYPLSLTSLVLRGDGMQSSVITTALNIEQLTNAGADASNGLLFPLIEDIEFKNTFTVTAGAGATNFHIHLKNPLRALIRNVRCRSNFNDTDHNDANHGGIQLELVSTFTSAFLNLIDSCYLDHAQVLVSTSDSVISNSIVYGHNCQYGIKSTSGNLTVTHCQIIGSRSKGGVWIAPGSLNSKIVNNFFDGSYDAVNSGYGIVVEPTSSTSSYVQITGNYFWRQYYAGILAIDTISTSIVGNQFWNCGRADSASDPLNSDIELRGVTLSPSTNTISNNTAFRSGTRSNLGLFILENNAGVNCANNIYSGNTVTSSPSAYKAAPIVLNLGLFSGGSKSIANAGSGTETESYSSFTGTGTGFATPPTGTIKYSVADNKVTLFFNAISGTSNSTAFTVTGMPAAIRPAAGVYGAVLIKNSGTDELGFINIATSGVISVFRTVGGLSLTSFTNSGTKEIGAGSTITYPLQ
jgi:hypothetical protein